MAAWTPADPDNFYLDAYVEKLSNPELVEKYGGTIHKIDKYKRKIKDGKVQVNVEVDPKKRTQETDQVTEAGNKRAIELRGTRIHTLAHVLAHFQIDQDVWEVESFIANKWDMGYTTAKKQARQHELYQIKARFRRRQGVEEIKNVIERLFEKAATRAPKYVPIRRPQTTTGRLLELNPVDQHMGKLAWKPESGESYDIKIARSAFITAIQDLVLRAVQIGPYDKILLVLGNDLLQMDNPENTTTAGTQVDCDSRYVKVYDETCEMCIQVIDWLMTYADVDILMVPGNHDRFTTFHLGKFLSAWYKNCENVDIDNSPTPRKYYKHGVTMFMYTHGNEEKHADLPMIMAQERKHLWADSIHRHIKIGHFHSKRKMTRVDINEELGVQLMTCPTLCGADAWHNMKGYVANIRRSEAYMYHNLLGPEGHLIYNLPEGFGDNV